MVSTQWSQQQQQEILRNFMAALHFGRDTAENSSEMLKCFLALLAGATPSILRREHEREPALWGGQGIRGGAALRENSYSEQRSGSKWLTCLTAKTELLPRCQVSACRPVLSSTTYLYSYTPPAGKLIAACHLSPSVHFSSGPSTIIQEPVAAIIHRLVPS